MTVSSHTHAMNPGDMLLNFGGWSVNTVVAGATVVLVMIVAIMRGRQAKVDSPKPRPVSIETELSMDVKRRWKNRYNPPTK